MPIQFYGKGASGVQTNASTNYSHVDSAFMNSITTERIPRFNVAAGQALTSEAAYTWTAWPGCWLYDIVVSYTSSSAGTINIDVYNTRAAGTAANSYFNLPILITPSITTTLTTISARFGITTASSVYKLQADPTWLTNSSGILSWKQNYVYPRGQVFSVRATTPPSTGSITGLDVAILLASGDNPNWTT